MFTYPAVFHIENKVIGSGYDNYQMLGWQYLAKTRVDTGKSVFGWTNYWRYPVGIDFSTSFDSIALISLGLYLYIFTSNPVVVFNFSILLLIFFSCILSFLYFKKISGTNTLGILGSIIYSFSFFVLVRVGGHINFLLVGCFPFLAYALIKLLEEQNRKSIFITAVATILVFVASLQYFLILIGSLILLVPLSYIFFKENFYSIIKILLKNRYFSLFCALLILFTFYLFFANDIHAIFDGNMYVQPLYSTKVFSARFTDYLWPNEDLPLLIKPPFYLPVLEGWNDRTVFLGYAEIFIFVLFIFSKVNIKTKMFILSGTLLLYILSLGCKNIYYPYCYIYHLYPYQGITEASRFYVVIYFLFVTGIVLLIKSLNNKIRLPVLAIVFILVVLERLPSNFYLSDTYADSAFIKTVQVQNSKAVLDLPVVVSIAGKSQGEYDLFSVYYQKPIVNGYIQRRGDTTESNSFVNYLNVFECGTGKTLGMQEGLEISETLKKFGIITIVFHKQPDIYVEDEPMFCDQAMNNIYYFVNESGVMLNKLFEDDQTIVFQIM